MNTKDDWKLWNDERESFAGRDTQGFKYDLEALGAHIIKLLDVCPRDKGGWPVGIALRVLDSLRKDYNRARDYLAFHTSD